MITEQERRDLDVALGGLQRRPGLEEEIVAGTQVTVLLGQLFEHMDACGMTQADLARAMGVHRRQVLRWFQGTNALKAETLIAMGRHAGLTLDALWLPMEGADAWASAPGLGCAELAPIPVDYCEIEAA